MIYDGVNRVLDLIPNSEGAGIPTRRYTFGLGVDEPLQLETFNDTSGNLTGRYLFHADQLGSIRFLTDAAGIIVNRYECDSYGKPLAILESVHSPFRILVANMIAQPGFIIIERELTILILVDLFRKTRSGSRQGI